jgi:hypothetical protein
MSSLKFHKQLAVLLLMMISGGFLNSDAQEIRSLDGGGLKAGSVAVEKFSSLISDDVGKGGVDGFLGVVEDYNVHINISDDFYTFLFVPKLYKGERIKGGGASIVIRKGDYKVIDFKYFK